MEFQVVGNAEDFPDGAALDRIDERSALPNPEPQNDVAEIRESFISRRNWRIARPLR
jgi:hypothetical protein